MAAPFVGERMPGKLKLDEVEFADAEDGAQASRSLRKK